MQRKRTFLKCGIMLTCLCITFAVSSNFVKVENTKAYVFSLSDQCVNTFSGDISNVTTEPSTEITTKPSTEPTTELTTDAPAVSTTESTTGETTAKKINTDKVSPPTGASKITSQLFIILPFAAILTAFIGIKKSRHA